MLLLKLSLKYLKKNKFSTLLTILVFIVVIFSISIINWIYKNIERNIINQEIGSEDNKIIITEKKQGFLGNLLNKKLLQKAYKKLKKDKNIERIYGIYSISIPTFAELNFFGLNFQTDTIVFASSDISGNKLKVGINPILINLYNSQLADGNLFPKINTEILKKIFVKLTFGKNSFISFNKQKSFTGTIEKLNPDYPLLGLTINYNIAKQIEKEIKPGSLKLYKIIAFVKNKAYILKLKQKYPQLKIEGYNEKLEKIQKKISFLELTFQIIKYIILFLLFAFIIFVADKIVQENKNNIKVLYYHGASLGQQFSLIFYNISFYILIAGIVSLSVVGLINKNINQLNQKIKEQGFFNIEIYKISYNNLLKNLFLLWIVTNLISFGIFITKKD